MRSSLQRITLFYLLTGFLLSSGCAQAQKKNPADQKAELGHLQSWVGEQPIGSKGNFLKLPKIASSVQEVMGDTLYQRLTNLRETPYYLTLPIEFDDGYYFLHYAPNGRFNRDADRVLIALRSDDSRTYVARVCEDDGTEWMGKNIKIVPAPIRRHFKDYLR